MSTSAPSTTPAKWRLQSIVGGDPKDRRATFTRFVLPFAWKLTPQSREHAGSTPYYRAATPDDWLHSASAGSTGSGGANALTQLDASRRKYCTRETADLLYQRARYWVLNSEPIPLQVPTHFAADDRPSCYTAMLRPPALALFEAPPKLISQPASSSLLRTGFLVLEVFFPEKAAPGSTGESSQAHLSPPWFEDILRFNEWFRYLECPFQTHREFCDREMQCLAQVSKGKAPDLYADKWLQWLSLPLQDATQFFTLAAEIHSSASPTEKLKPLLVQPDDRAFVFTSVFLPRSEQAEKQDIIEPTSPVAKVASDMAAARERWLLPWIALLNVDRVKEPCPPSACTPYELEWARPRSYTRWAHSGMLYGFTPHSWALLASADPQATNHGEPELAVHARHQYFDLTLLILYLRCTLFRFSGRLHEISANVAGSKDRVRWRKDFAGLRWQFMVFENLYQWPLLSNQQQHLEMYEVQRRAMDTRELYEEVRKEILNSDEILESLISEERNERADRLNRVAYSGLLANTLLAAVALVLTSLQTMGPEKPLDSYPILVCVFHAALAGLGIGCFLYLLKSGRPSINLPNTPSKHDPGQLPAPR